MGSDPMSPYSQCQTCNGGKSRICDHECQRAYGEKIIYEDIHCVSTILRDCDDIELGFTMYEEDKNVWRCSFRSDGKWVNVNELLQPFGGGGHISAAGLKYKTDNVEELKNRILDRVEELRARKQK